MTLPASVAGGERPRVFCALLLPNDAVERLVLWQQRELHGGRIVPPENLHVTLAFLGSTPTDRIDDIVAELRQAAAGAERPVLTAVGYRETRSVGMLVLDDLDERATALAEDVHGRLERLGVYEREQRRWLPHLTVLRFRERPRLRPPLPDLGEVCPSGAAVYMSVLQRTGAQYEILASVALGGE